MELTDREKVILEALVELYVRDAGPVSSGQLHRELPLEVSSATIRNVLHGLEDKGLLQQPHTSAGRAPTREGYRAYVDQLVRPTRLPEAWLRRIRAELQLGVQDRDVHAVLDRVSRLLAELSSNLGVGVAIEDRRDARIHRIELVGLEAGRLLAVVTLDNGLVCTETLRLERETARDALDAAARLLNELVADRTPMEARLRLEAALLDHSAAGGDIARRVALEWEHLFDEERQPTLHLDGATQIMGQPEFTDPENLRLLVRILDHPESLGALLVERRSLDEPFITIGVESEREELRPFSLVTAPYNVGGLQGFVAILGPMRMRYALALTLVSTVTAALRSVLDEPS